MSVLSFFAPRWNPIRSVLTSVRSYAEELPLLLSFAHDFRMTVYLSLANCSLSIK